MAKRDLRSEQVKLLRFERLVEAACRDFASGRKLNKKPVLAGLPFLAAAGAAAAQKLGANEPLRHVAEVELVAHSAGSDSAWLLQLAETVTKGHNAIEALAEQGSWLLVHGTPKRATAEVVQSLLTNGPF